MYAGLDSASSAASTGPSASSASSASASAEPSTSIRTPGYASSAVVITTTGVASASMNRTRSAGYDRSTGTYIAPAASTPSNATTESADRGNATATGSPGPTPAAINHRANRFTRPASSPNNSSTSPHTSAVSSGSAAARAANNAGTSPGR